MRYLVRCTLALAAYALLGLGSSVLLAATTTTKDWPQACYNETSMWVTSACKEYIETVYYPSLAPTTTTTTSSETTYLAAPAPLFASGLGGVLLLALASLLLRYSRRAAGHARV
jgi:hypothetical protein